MDSDDRVNPDLLRLLPFDARLLVEVGCGSGALGEQYQRLNPYCRYLGIEPDADAAAVARRRLDHVAIGAAEHVEIGALGLEPGSVDCIIYDQTLERLRDPVALLQRHAAWLRPGGEVVACVPNVQSWLVVLGLLKGQWGADAEGPFDHEQVRFFTLRGVNTLFEQAGLEVFDVEPRPATQPPFADFQKLLGPVVQALGVDPQQFAQHTAALQFVVRALRPGLGQPRRLLIQTVIDNPIGSSRVRAVEPDAFSATIPGVRSRISSGQAEIIAQAGADKVFVFQGVRLEPDKHLPVLRQLLQADYLLVTDIDDDPARLPHYEKTNFFDLRACHCIQAATEPLAEYLRTLNPHVVVFPNQIAYLPPPRQYEAGSVKLFFGALNRSDDWPMIVPALNAVLADYRDRLKVCVVHDRAFFDALETDAKVFEPTCPFERYSELLGTRDIGLLPLSATSANAMKSDLKFLECAARGVVALASPTAYEATIVEGETGFLFRTPEEFAAKLRQLIADADLRHRVAAKAYDYVKEHRLLAQHYRRRRDWYCRMRDRLPELTAELRRRVPEL